MVVVHFDHGNLRRCFLLAIGHFIFDVVPFYIYCWWTGKKASFYFKKSQTIDFGG